MRSPRRRAARGLTRARRRKLGLMVAVLGAGLAVLPSCAAWSRPEPRPGEDRFSAWDLMTDVARLASPQMEGRAAGWPGAEKAAEFIADEFRRAGLNPGGEGGGYLQPFELAARTRLGTAARLVLSVEGPPARSRTYVPSADYVPFGFSEDGEVEAEIVFAGYGITAPEHRYDDYAGVDVRGKAVLVLSHVPRELDPRSPFRRPGTTQYATNRYKAENARAHGAVAMLLVADPNNHREEREFLSSLTGPAETGSGIVAVNVRRQVVEPLLFRVGRTLSQLQQRIDDGLAPHSFSMAGMKVGVTVALEREKGATANVVGVLPGRDPVLRDEAVVIAAHYDHVGLGGANSLAIDQYNTVHPGADVNASGTAVLLALARAFGATGGTKRSLVFVAFSGTEVGRLGSYHYVRRPAIPIERTVAMVNLVGVGRLRDEPLSVEGIRSGEGLRGIVRQARRGLDLELDFRNDARVPGDDARFRTSGRPAVRFFGGPHEDQYRPSDTPDKINAEGLRAVTTLVFRTVGLIADRPTPIVFRGSRDRTPSG
jgi:aminopeptidase YwaD